MAMFSGSGNHPTDLQQWSLLGIWETNKHSHSQVYVDYCDQ